MLLLLSKIATITIQRNTSFTIKALLLAICLMLGNYRIIYYVIAKEKCVITLTSIELLHSYVHVDHEIRLGKIYKQNFTFDNVCHWNCTQCWRHKIDFTSLTQTALI